MMRGSCAPLMRPKVAAVATLVPGLLKFTVLNRLKNSARNSAFVAPGRLNRLDRLRSTVQRFGPKYSPLRVSPNEPFGFTANAAALKNTNRSEPAGGSDRRAGPRPARGG